MRLRYSVVAVAATVFAGAASVPAFVVATHAAAAPGPALLSSIPDWAIGAHSAGVVPADARVGFEIVMRTRNSAALDRTVAAVGDPSSPSYRHFLTPAEYASRFAPTSAAAAAVTGWLRASGLSVDAVSPRRTIVSGHGSAAQVEAAMHVGLTLVRHQGMLLRVPTGQPQLPAALHADVAGVAGLAQEPMHGNAAPAPAFFNARPCSSYFGQKTDRPQPKYNGKHLKYAICGYTPKQLRSAYGVNKVHLSGSGVTVAIVDTYASPTIVADANTYSKRHGLPKLKPGQLVQHTHGAASNPPEVAPGGLGVVDPQGWAGEESLDVEAVHAIAPGADIQYYAAPTNFSDGLETTLNKAVEDGKAQVISNSWGSADDSPDPVSQTMLDDTTKEAAATGVTIDFSSGDDGDETAPAADGQRTADWPATSPLVTAVGGTTLVVNHKGRRVKETYWGTFKTPLSGKAWNFTKTVFNGAGGGGVSTTYAEPSWQKGVVPTSYATYGGVKPGRVEPDVSMDADSTTGFLMGQTMTPKGGKPVYNEYRIGGTSLSCPLFSALVALAVQRHHHKGIGQVDPTLYRHSRTAAGRRKLFNDPSGVKVGAHRLSLFANIRPDYADTSSKSSAVTYSLRTLGNLETLHHRKGYDDSTGLGTPKAAAVVKLLG